MKYEPVRYLITDNENGMPFACHQIVSQAKEPRKQDMFRSNVFRNVKVEGITLKGTTSQIKRFKCMSNRHT